MPVFRPPQIKEFIIQHVKEVTERKLQAPTIKEIAEGYAKFKPEFAITTSALNSYVTELIKDGILERQKERGWRNLKLSNYGHQQYRPLKSEDRS